MFLGDVMLEMTAKKDSYWIIYKNNARTSPHKINVITVNFCGEGKSAKTFRNRNGLSVAPLWGGALEINSNDTNKNYC